MTKTAGTPDPRVRRFVLPERLLWTSEAAAEGAENLLSDDDNDCVLKPGGAVLLDFGRELHGGVRMDTTPKSTHRPAAVRVRFGESASEAMGAPNQDHAIHDFQMLLPWWGQAEVGNTGFRFVRIDVTDAEASVSLRSARAVHLVRPLDYRGSFRCSDPLLERIWDVSAYTVHLCMQDHVWDGIKRDRLVWIGDIHPESMVISTVFGEVDVLPASLDYVRDRTPVPGWMNGISSYSIWWIITQRDWYRYHGNREYLLQQRDYLVKLLDRLQELVDGDGREHLDGTRFLDWPTSEDPLTVNAGLQALTALGLQMGAWLCREMGDDEAAARAEACAGRAAAFRPEPCSTKQANALMVLAGMRDAEEADREVFSRDPFHGVSPFFGYYVLQARALAGDFDGCLDLIRSHWGGMLQMGATTFWEGFDIDWMEGSARIDELPVEGMRDIHADFGGYCYKGLRHSLCHGWAGGPAVWLSEHVLGVKPASPGFREVRIEPHLGTLEWASGTVPTPLGDIEVEHRQLDGRVESTVRLPDGVRQTG